MQPKRKKDKKVSKKTSKRSSKQADISAALKTFTQKFGDGAIQLLAGDGISKNLDVISTGSILLDNALGINGLPYGRVIEIFGPEGGGKTTLALHIIASAQKQGKNAMFIDAEHALDPELAKKVGVDANSLYISQPMCGEEALDIAEHALDVGHFSVIVIDSVAALVPRAELDGEMGDMQMGLQARMMGKALRKFTGKAAKSNTMVIFINQIRMKIGVVFGNPETTSGGNALKFYSSVRLDIRRTGSIKRNDKIIGNKVRVKVVKNKLAPPYVSIDTDLIFGKGFSKSSELITMAHDFDVLKFKGSWISFEDETIAQGRDALSGMMDRDPKLYTRIFEATELAKDSGVLSVDDDEEEDDFDD